MHNPSLNHMTKTLIKMFRVLVKPFHELCKNKQIVAESWNWNTSIHAPGTSVAQLWFSYEIVALDHFKSSYQFSPSIYGKARVWEKFLIFSVIFLMSQIYQWKWDKMGAMD